MDIQFGCVLEKEMYTPFEIMPDDSCPKTYPIYLAISSALYLNLPVESPLDRSRRSRLCDQPRGSGPVWGHFISEGVKEAVGD